MGKEHELIGRTIAGKFVVEDLIGSGAMGAVYRARQAALEKTVAIKVLHGEHAGDPAFAARFQREAKAASRLNHPNSMQVIDFGCEPDGLLYIAMEFLNGRSLHRLLRDDWPLSPVRVADLLMQTLGALGVAHGMGIVHRDLKPENIVVLSGTDDDGRPRDVVKVCDFGIAKITDSRAYRADGQHHSDRPLTTAGFLVGTPEYMSPEQGRGESLDARSDIYSVGVVLYEMLTGRVPFEAGNAIGVVFKHITEEPPRPSALNPAVDRRLEAICVRAMQKSRDERYPTAREMRADLRNVADPRGMQLSSPELPALVEIPKPPPSVSTAPTQAAALAVPVAAPPDDGARKPTLAGTSSTVPGISRRRRALVVSTAVVALLSGIGVATFVSARLRAAHERSASSVAAAPMSGEVVPAATGGGVAPSSTSAAAADPQRAVVSLPSNDVSRVPLHGATHAAAAKSGPIPSAASVAVAPPSAAPPPPAPATAVSVAVAASAPPPSPAPPPAAAAPPPEAADPSFDPDKGYAEVGLINAQGVPQSAIRGALRGVALAQCYRVALKARGARAGGVAMLALSIDENGAVRSAITTGADFLPGLTGCLQRSVYGLHVAKAQVDPNGASADVTIAFRVP